MKSSHKKKNKINEMNLNLHMNAASLLQLPPWQQLLSTHGQLPVTVPFTSSRGLKPYRSVKFSERSNNNSCISTERRELPNLRTGKQLKRKIQSKLLLGFMNSRPFFEMWSWLKSQSLALLSNSNQLEPALIFIISESVDYFLDSLMEVME